MHKEHSLIHVFFCFFTGQIINKKDRCVQCQGKKIIEELKVLQVEVEKGAHDGDRIVFHGEGDREVYNNYKLDL